MLLIQRVRTRGNRSVEYQQSQSNLMWMGKLLQANNLFLPTRYVQFLVSLRTLSTPCPLVFLKNGCLKNLRSFPLQLLSQNVNKANVTITISK